jgi:hypothetical protein
MRHRITHPILALAVVVLMVGLACAGPALAQPTATSRPLPIATQPPVPTQPPEPTATNPPQSGDVLYSTTFADLSDWTVFTKADDQSAYNIDGRSDGLYVNVPTANDYAYFYYEPLGNPSDVQIEADVELLAGTNYTYITLLCRDSSDGRYSFILDTGGYWQIGRTDYGSSTYTRLADGGSTAIKVAKAKNHMTAICNQDTFTFLINGVKLGSATDSTYTEGEVGLSVKTFDYPHSEVAIHSFEIYMP